MHADCTIAYAMEFYHFCLACEADVRHRHHFFRPAAATAAAAAAAAATAASSTILG